MIQLLLAAVLAFNFILVNAQNEGMAIQTLCMFEARIHGIDIDTQEGWEQVEMCRSDTKCFLVSEEQELWECVNRDDN